MADLETRQYNDPFDAKHVAKRLEIEKRHDPTVKMASKEKIGSRPLPDLSQLGTITAELEMRRSRLKEENYDWAFNEFEKMLLGI